MAEPEQPGPVLYNTSLNLEKELRNVVRKKGVLEKESHQLRRGLRLCYTNLILHHYELSVQHDIEQSLWKTIFYKVIEALRARLRRLKSMRVSNPSESLETELQKTSSTFSAFLTSASKFYIGLVAKLEVAFGLLYGGTPDYILPEEDGSKGAGRGGKEWEIRQRGYTSCYRCYIFLGDLTRYIRDIGGESKEWMIAAKYYNRALRLFPTNGNPHNQLAVLATYVNDDFNAMYHYFRSIAAAKPFPTSKENLMVLFEKNRGQAENLQEALAPLLNGRRRTTENRVLRDSFLVFFIRIHGIIFNKVSVEKISQYKTLALKGFEDLLQQRRSSSSPSDAATTTTTSTSPTNANENANEGISEPLLLKVFAINIYAIWSCMAECDIHPGDSYAEKMKKSVILRHAAKIAVEFFGRTVRACQSSKQFGDLPFLGPLSTFTDWLGGNIASVMPTSSQDKGPWHQMWKAFISFLNKLIDNDPSLRDCASLFEGEVRSGNEVLREEIEMRGFLPFQDIHKGVLNFSGIPLFDFSPYEVSEDEQIKGLRLKKLIHFGVKMSKSSEVQSIHYLEDKGMFSDRRASSMSGGGGGKKGVSGVGGEGGAGGGKKNKSRGRSVSTNGMDPNAAPINPYEGEQFLYGSPILSSPLGRGGGERGRGEEGSGEEEEEILFRPRVSPHLSGSYDSRYFSFREDPPTSPLKPKHMSASTPSIPSPPSFSSSHSPSSMSHASLSDFSYPFAPSEGRENHGGWGGESSAPSSPSPLPSPSPSSSRFENEFSSWGIPLGTLQHPTPSQQQQEQSHQDISPSPLSRHIRPHSPTSSPPSSNFFPSSSPLKLNEEREGGYGWGEGGGKVGEGKNGFSSFSRGFRENNNSNYPHHSTSTPQSNTNNTINPNINKERRGDPLNGLPSFFTTSLSSTARYDSLEQNGSNNNYKNDANNNKRRGGEEDELGEISLPVIATNPIEDDDDDEDLESSVVGLDMFGKSPVQFFGPSSWQNVWNTPPQTRSPLPSPSSSSSSSSSTTPILSSPPPPSSLPPSPQTPTLGVQGRFRTNSGSGWGGGGGGGGGLYGGYSSFNVGVSPAPSPSHYAQNWNFSPNLEKPAP